MLSKDVAATYARNGWPVLPLHEPQGSGCTCGHEGCKVGKHPRIPEWQKTACDLGTVEQWWAQWPTANLGLRLDNLIVLDVDGPEGMASLDALEQEHGQLDRRAYQHTGSGEGLHFLFEAVPGIEKRVKFQPGLDLLTGSGSLIVVEPSLHASGYRYKWDGQSSPLSMHRDEISLTVPPGWLLEAAADRKPKLATRATRPPAERTPLADILRGALDRLRAGAGRNDAGLWLFCQVRDAGYARAEAVQLVREWVSRANEAQPGEHRYTMHEAEASLSSAYKRDPRDPWEDPEGGKRPTQIKTLEELSSDIDLFHSPKGEAFARVPVKDHTECCAVESKALKGILTSRYFRAKNATPGRDVLQSYVDLLCARAKYDGPERETYLRFAHVEHSAYSRFSQRYLAGCPNRRGRLASVAGIPRSASGV